MNLLPLKVGREKPWGRGWQVSGGKATLIARVLRYVRAAQQILEPEHNDATCDSELQSSDSEDPDDSEDVGSITSRCSGKEPAFLQTRNERAAEIEPTEDDAQSDSSEMGDFIEHSYEVLFVPDTDVECVTVHRK